jgi:predicted transposase YdaD
MSDEEIKARELARVREKAQLDENSRMKWAKLEGKLESSIEIAKNFLRLGLPIPQIALGTGLTEKEIMGLA